MRTLFAPLWIAVLAAASAGLTTSFTCIAPFAAFAVIAATTLSPRQAFVCTVAVWLANQVTGFVALLLVNAVALVGFVGLHQLAVIVLSARRRRLVTNQART